MMGELNLQDRKLTKTQIRVLRYLRNGVPYQFRPIDKAIWDGEPQIAQKIKKVGKCSGKSP